MPTRKEVSVDTILFCTMVLPSLVLLAVFFIGVAVLAFTVGEDYQSPTTTTETTPCHPT